jgi:FSR family fosmidomycin resistance protein-like MFS transporter
VIPHGQGSIAWFSALALVAMLVLTGVGNWFRRERAAPPRPHLRPAAGHASLSRRRIAWAVAILLVLIFSKSFYTTSLSTYLMFYLMTKFQVGIATAQIYLFALLASVAVGTLIGGPLGDRIGRKYVLWGSIVGVLPFTLVLPYAGLYWTGVLIVVIGLILSSASSTIIVYALDLVPGKIGTVAGLFFGLSFGLGGLGAAALGKLADMTSIDFVYQLCAFLPAIGLLTAFLPDLNRASRRVKAAAA